MVPSRPAKLPSLDLGRFYAALLVVLFHYSFMIRDLTGRAPFGMLFYDGRSGVEYFFVLSGFIIYYVHERDLGRPETMRAFASKRATRILPMLWLILIGWWLLRNQFAGETTRGATPVSTLLLDMLLLPHSGPSVLGITWTLTREFVFYILFAVAIADRRAGLALIALWQAGVLVCSVLRIDLPMALVPLFETHNIGFGIGMLIAAARPLASRTLAMAVAAAGIAGFAALLAIEWHVGADTPGNVAPLGRWASPILYTAAAALIVRGVASVDVFRTRPERPLTSLLGGCSYVLYLVHIPFGSIAIRVVRRVSSSLPPEVTLLLLAAGATAAAAILHRTIERPILRRLRPKRS